MNINSNSTKSRNWATIGYTESMPENWLEILQEAHVDTIISPLHDRDVHSDGTIKKPHYHIMLRFDGPERNTKAKEIFEKIKSVGVERVNSFVSMARYFIHIDNPEKAQYDPDDVTTFGNINYKDVILSDIDKYKVTKEIVQFIKENDITEYTEIFDYAMNNNEIWFRALCDNSTYTVNKYIESRRNQKKNKAQYMITAEQYEEMQRLESEVKNQDEESDS